MNFSALPVELKLHIFSHLDGPALYNASQVSSEWHSLAHDRSIESPFIDPQVLDNLHNKNYIVTETPLDSYLGANQYLHLVDGKPTLSTAQPDQNGNFITQINSKTAVTTTHFGSLQKRIKIGEDQYFLNYNTLYQNDVAKRYNVKDIASFHGKLIYSSSANRGIYLFVESDGLFTLDTERFGTKKIADSFLFEQIVCDEKNGLIYGVSDKKLIKLDFKNAKPKLKTRTSDNAISYIGRLILKTLGNLIGATIFAFKWSWKAHAIGASIAFIGGIVLGIALSAANVLFVGVALLMMAEFILVPALATIGLFTGIGLTVKQILTGKI